MHGTQPLKIKHHSLTGRITHELMTQAFRSVRKNRGAAGVDRQSLEMFEAHLETELSTCPKTTPCFGFPSTCVFSSSNFER